MKCPITGKEENLIKLTWGTRQEYFHEDVTVGEIHRWER